MVLLAVIVIQGNAEASAHPHFGDGALTAVQVHDGIAGSGDPCPTGHFTGAGNCHATVVCQMCAVTEEFVSSFGPAVRHLLPGIDLLRASQTIEPQLQPPQNSRSS